MIQHDHIAAAAELNFLAECLPVSFIQHKFQCRAFKKNHPHLSFCILLGGVRITEDCSEYSKWFSLYQNDRYKKTESDLCLKS